MTLVDIGGDDIAYVYGQMKNAGKMGDPAERLLGAIVLRAVMDWYDPKYRQEVEEFFQSGLASWLDVDWMKTIRTIGGRT